MSIPVVRALPSLAMIVALLALTYTAARWGLADVYSTPARRAMSRWDNLKIHAPPPDEWRPALDGMRAAHVLDPTNAIYTEDMGRLYDFAAGNRNDRATSSFRRQALIFFTDASRQRITYPYSWSNITLVKLKLGEIDAAFFQGLKNAAFFGPWESQVQFAIADAGLSTWQSMPNEMRDIVNDTITRGKRWSAVEMQRLVESRRPSR